MSAGPEEIAPAVARLRAGGVVAFPTETVYGLGADAMNTQAVGRVFALKGRPATNPLIVHVSGEAMARTVAAPGAWTKDAAALARAFWPGPLTMVLAKSERVPPIVTGGGGGATVAVRCPAHHVTLAMIEGFGGPIVGPSANPSGRVSPTTAAHVRGSFNERDVLVLDGGACRGGIESTVVSLADSRVLRPGPVSAEQIAAVLGRAVEGARAGEAAPAGEAAAAPGMQARHYAPRTRAVLFDATDEARVVASLLSPDRRVAVVSARLPGVPPPHVLVRMPQDAEGYAARLYAAMREADELGLDLIAVERPTDPGSLWDAIRDRLSRATSPAGDAIA